VGLTPGTKVGPYEVVAALGKGGMGEVVARVPVDPLGAGRDLRAALSRARAVTPDLVGRRDDAALVARRARAVLSERERVPNGGRERGAFGTPHALYEGRFRPPLNANTNDDVSPDGKRFLRVRQAGPDVPLDRIQVVLAWFEELRAR